MCVHDHKTETCFRQPPGIGGFLRESELIGPLRARCVFPKAHPLSPLRSSTFIRGEFLNFPSQILSSILICAVLFTQMSKPNVLVLGGVGFIGRNFVKWLVDKGVAGKIRVIDKVLPATAFLGKEHQDAFNHPSVEYKQGNLTSVRMYLCFHWRYYSCLLP